MIRRHLLFHFKRWGIQVSISNLANGSLATFGTVNEYSLCLFQTECPDTYKKVCSSSRPGECNPKCFKIPVRQLPFTLLFLIQLDNETFRKTRQTPCCPLWTCVSHPRTGCATQLSRNASASEVQFTHDKTDLQNMPVFVYAAMYVITLHLNPIICIINENSHKFLTPICPIVPPPARHLSPSTATRCTNAEIDLFSKKSHTKIESNLVISLKVQPRNTQLPGRIPRPHNLANKR